MKTLSIVTLAFAAFAIHPAARGTDAATAEPVAKAAAATTEPVGKAEPATKDDTAKGKLVLVKGLEGEAILKGYGKPYQVKPMDSPDKDTKVEQWIYRRKVKEFTTQTASGQTTEVRGMASAAGPGVVGEFRVPEYRLKHIIVYQVTELLMINGKLQIAKQWMGQEENLQ